MNYFGPLTIVAIILTIIVIAEELRIYRFQKKNYNNATCIKCGKSLIKDKCHFDNSIRMYHCEECNHKVGVHFKSIDKETK